LLLGDDLIARGIGESFEVGRQPLDSTALLKAGDETAIHLRQIADVVQCVLDLSVGERALAPIRVRISLIQFHAEHLMHKSTVADLLRESGERGGDLRVKHGSARGTAHSEEYFEILTAGVKHLHDRLVVEQLAQWAHVLDTKRIDDRAEVICAKLDQAQFGEIRPLSHELSINTDNGSLTHAGDELFECFGVGDIH